MIAGILNKFGKIGVVIGFLIGTVTLTFFVTGNTAPIIHLREIVIASIGLLIVPKNINIHITDLVGKTKLLPISKERMLEENEETVYKLNSVSETISEISKSYSEVAATTLEDTTSKDVFIDSVLDALEDEKNNILYEDIADVQNGILDEIYEKFEEKNEIYMQDIIDIFENHNSYIVGMEEDISNIAKIINNAGKEDYARKRIMQASNENISRGLNGVSKAISNIAENISKKDVDKFQRQKEEIEILLLQKNINVYDINIKRETNGRTTVDIYTKSEEQMIDEVDKIQKTEEILTKVFGEKMTLKKQKEEAQTFASEDKFKMAIAITGIKKDGSDVSGDNSLKLKMEDGKVLLALSDGMGSGAEANKASDSIIKMTKKLMSAGFEKEAGVELINNGIAMKTQNEMFASLDISIFDLYTGTLELLKNYACPTYIKRGKEVKLIHAISLPTGILTNIDSVIFDTDLKQGDIVVMCTDGVLEANKEAINKEEEFKKFLEAMKPQSAKKMADIILQEAIDQDYGKPKDDMTVIVAKIE